MSAQFFSQLRRVFQFAVAAFERRVLVRFAMSKWKQFVIEVSLAVSGGFSKRPLAVQAKQSMVDGVDMAFVKVEKNLDWMLKMLLGTARKGSLRRTTLIETLRAKAAAAGEETTGCAEKPEPEAGTLDDDRDDPMSTLADLDNDNKFVTPKKSHKRKKLQDHIITIEMPEHHRDAVAGKTAAVAGKVNPFLGKVEIRQVQIYREGRTSIFIAVHDVPWMLTWMSEEVRTGCVEPLPDDEEQLIPNSSVEGVHIRWSFDGAWEATVVADGTSVKSYVSKMCADKWATLPQWRAQTFDTSTNSDRKSAAKQFLETHMAKKMRGNDDRSH